MNKFLLILFTLIIFNATGSAYENNMLNMQVPTRLESSELEVSIRHRFIGAVDDDTFGTFFGMDTGANINVGMRYPIITGLEASVNYIRFKSEYDLGLSYKLPVQFFKINSQFSLEYFTFEKFGIEERRNNFFYQLSLQSEQFKIISFAANIAYDAYHQRSGVAVGANIHITEDWNFSTEYYPVINRDDDADGRINIGEKDFFALGITYKTYAHHFTFIFSNGYQIGNRDLMLGTSSNDVYFGFNIQRKLYL